MRLLDDWNSHHSIWIDLFRRFNDHWITIQHVNSLTNWYSGQPQVTQLPAIGRFIKWIHLIKWDLLLENLVHFYLSKFKLCKVESKPLEDSTISANYLWPRRESVVLTKRETLLQNLCVQYSVQQCSSMNVYRRANLECELQSVSLNKRQSTVCSLWVSSFYRVSRYAIRLRLSFNEKTLIALITLMALIIRVW